MTEDLRIVALTLATALAATILIFPFGLVAAWLLARWRGFGSGVVDTVLSLPLVLPPTAVGMVLLSVLSGDALGIVFTRKAVVLSSAVMAFPLFVRSARTGFEDVDPRLVAVARTLGCTRAAAFFRVTLPVAWRGVLAGTVLAFSRALGEFGATILVAGNIPGRTQTLALAIFHRTQIGDDAGAMRLVVITTLLAFVALWSTAWVTRARTRKLER